MLLHIVYFAITTLCSADPIRHTLKYYFYLDYYYIISVGIGGWKLKLAAGYSLQTRSGEFIFPPRIPTHSHATEYPCQLALIMFPLQEAAALNELEERMKSSNHLLARKEQAISQLQASLAQQVITWLTLSKETKGRF
jgi:hypothetical protein